MRKKNLFLIGLAVFAGSLVFDKYQEIKHEEYYETLNTQAKYSHNLKCVVNGNAYNHVTGENQDHEAVARMILANSRLIISMSDQEAGKRPLLDRVYVENERNYDFELQTEIKKYSRLTSEQAEERFNEINKKQNCL